MALREREIGSVVEPEDAFSTTEIEKQTFSFTWDIVNFPELGENLFSPVFKAGSNGQGQGQHEWQLQVCPHSKKNASYLVSSIVQLGEDSEVEEYIGIFLHLHRSASDNQVKATFRCSLMDSSRQILRTQKNSRIRNFGSETNKSGWSQWILRSKIMNPVNGFLSQGHMLRVHCDIFMCGNIQHLAVSSRPKILNNLDSDSGENLVPNLKSSASSSSKSAEEIMLYFLARGKFSDVTLKTENESFPCSKFILAAHSPVFEAMFDSGMLESTENIVRIKDFSDDAVRWMILFVCIGKTQLPEENAGELLSISDKYQISGLKEKCEETLLKNLCVENAADTLILAHLHSPQTLQPQVIYFINRFKKQVVNTEGYKSMIKTHPIICSELYASLE